MRGETCAAQNVVQLDLAGGVILAGFMTPTAPFLLELLKLVLIMEKIEKIPEERYPGSRWLSSVFIRLQSMFRAMIGSGLLAPPPTVWPVVLLLLPVPPYGPLNHLIYRYI